MYLVNKITMGKNAVGYEVFSDNGESIFCPVSEQKVSSVFFGHLDSAIEFAQKLNLKIIVDYVVHKKVKK